MAVAWVARASSRERLILWLREAGVLGQGGLGIRADLMPSSVGAMHSKLARQIALLRSNHVFSVAVL